jgi:hypothetical protein
VFTYLFSVAANTKPKKAKVAAPDKNQDIPEQPRPVAQPSTDQEKPTEEPKPVHQNSSDPQKPNEVPSAEMQTSSNQPEPHDTPRPNVEPGPSEPFNFGQLQLNEQPKPEKPTPAERPASAQSRTSVQDAPIQARTSIASTSSRRPSTPSRTSRTPSKASLSSQSETQPPLDNALLETPRSVDSEAVRRFCTAGIVAETVTAATREKKNSAAAQSKACNIL